MENNIDTDLIDKYLLNQMNEKEATDFETRLEKEEGLQAELVIQQKLIKGLKSAKEDAAFFSMLTKIKQETEEEDITSNESISKIFNLNTRIAVAASIAVLLAIGWFLFRPTTNLNGTQLVQKYYQKPSTELILNWAEGKGYVNSLDENGKKIIKLGITAYNKNDTRNAKEAFINLKNSTPPQGILNKLADFYLAQIARQNNDFRESIALLEPLTTIEGLPFLSEVYWYSGLSYIGNKEEGLGRKTIEKIEKNQETTEMNINNLLKQL